MPGRDEQQRRAEVGWREHEGGKGHAGTGVRDQAGSDRGLQGGFGEAQRVNGEPGTLRYEQYLSDDGRRAINLEVFRDADAFVDHNRNVADLVPALFDAGPVVHLDVIGEVNDAMREELAFAAASYLAPLGSIDR